MATVGLTARAQFHQPGALALPDDLRTAMLRHLRAAAPLEGVGLFAVPEGDEDGGSLRAQRGAARGPESAAGGGEGADEGSVVRVVWFYPGTNGAASATRYTMPPEEVLAAFTDMRARGWRLGAIVHSHPRGPATPSPTDLREAYYPEALMVIVSFAVAEPEVRAWWVGAADGQPREVPVVGGGDGGVPAREERGGDAVTEAYGQPGGDRRG